MKETAQEDSCTIKKIMKVNTYKINFFLYIHLIKIDNFQDDDGVKVKPLTLSSYSKKLDWEISCHNSYILTLESILGHLGVSGI